MEFFQFISLVAAILVSAVLCNGLSVRRFVVVKPSFWIALCFHLRVQWAAVLQAGEMYNSLPRPWEMFLLCHFFPLACAVWSLVAFNRIAEKQWKRVKSVPLASYHRLLGVAKILMLFAVCAMTLYFMWVPFRSTGLYVALASGDFLLSREARELSLKLLVNPIPRYAFALNANFFARAFAVCVVLVVLVSRREKRLLVIAALIGGCLVAMVASCVSGARSPGGFVVVAALLAVFLARGAPIDLRLLLVGATLTVLIPTLITLLRSGEVISFGALKTAFLETVFGRIFATPLHVAIYHVDYVQRGEFWGIGGFPKLATLFGMESQNVDNIIANAYRRGGTETTSYSTVGAVFTDYSRFGLYFFPVTVILIVMLDSCLLLVKRIRTPYLLVPMISCLVLASTFVVSSNYETILLTRGFLVAPLFFMWYDWKRIRQRKIPV